MSVDTSSFLADLLASVTEDLSKTKDPFDVLEDAVKTLNAASKALKDQKQREYNEFTGIYLYTPEAHYQQDVYGHVWDVAADLIAKGVMTVPAGSSWLQAGQHFNPALKPWAIERVRLTHELEEAVAAERTARRDIDHTDLPVGTLLSLRTKDGNYYGVQVGTIAKVGVSTYTVEFETWHPQYRHHTGSSTARLDRSDGSTIRPDGTCGYRHYRVLAGPGKVEEMKAKMLTRRNAEREQQRMIDAFVAENNNAWNAYEQDQSVGQRWDARYRQFGIEAEQKAREFILNKYREEMMALTLSFQQQMIDDAGQRPESTMPKPSHPRDMTSYRGAIKSPNYWRNHASEHLLGLVDDLQAVIDQPIEGLE
jgi:hypothetical protein